MIMLSQTSSTNFPSTRGVNKFRPLSIDRPTNINDSPLCGYFAIVICHDFSSLAARLSSAPLATARHQGCTSPYARHRHTWTNRRRDDLSLDTCAINVDGYTSPSLLSLTKNFNSSQFSQGILIIRLLRNGTTVSEDFGI